jgi:ATP-binding cassette subfamily F protein uup
MLLINGQQRHIIGYLEDFLFTPERTRSPARYLSGGERNRLLLARLFSKPSNVLVLDEPTNDLDAETLDLLEELIVGYAGTVLLVSHDRAFLNNVVTNTLVFEGDGHVRDYTGGYDDWLAQRRAIAETANDRTVATPVARVTSSSTTASTGMRRRSFKEQQELSQLPRRIELLEIEQRELHERMASPDFYQQDKNAISKATNRLQEIESELTTCFDRWEILEALAD